MKKIFSIIILFISLSAFSQDPFLQKSNPKLEKEAIEITNSYNLELSLTGKQKLLFQQKVEEFLIRRQKIEAEMTGKEKLDMLYRLQREETAEINNIITHPQMEVYKKVKPRIQPLETVKNNE